MAKTVRKSRKKSTAKRDIGTELLRSVREMKAGARARVHRQAPPKH
jgi:hypothetical protein